MAAGYLLGSQGSLQWGLAVVLAGVSLVIGGACAINNYLDQGIDRVMNRTKKRPLVTGAISGRSAQVYGGALVLAGLLLLALFTNPITLAVTLVGLVDYVVLYGIAKRRSVYGTIVGSVSGAVPIVAGYTAATGQLDAGAWLLFLIMVLWQMPHFYAIAIYRLSDYAAAKLPVLPVKSGIKVTKIQIIAYVVAFLGAIVALSLYGYAGYGYLFVMALLSLAWLFKGLSGFKKRDDVAWAKGMFGFSLIVLLVMSVMISVDSTLR